MGQSASNTGTRVRLRSLGVVSSLVLGIASLTIATLPASATTTCPAGGYDLYSPGGFSITCGTNAETYSQFGYSASAGGSASAVPATEVNVTPVQTLGNEGFQFADTWSATSESGAGGFQDSQISFTVATQTAQIQDLDLSFTGTFSVTGHASVTETFCLNHALAGCPAGSMGQATVTDPPASFSDTVFFAAASSVSVDIDVNVGSGSEGSASISQVTATFSDPPVNPSPCTATGTTSGAVTTYATPTTDSSPEGIVCGPDGRLWFTEEGANRIGAVTQSGVVSEYSLAPRTGTTPEDITVGPDGNLWFLEQGINRIAKMNTSGTVLADYKVTGSNVQLESITLGPDGNLWFTDAGQSRIGKITTAGAITFYQLAKGRGPNDIVNGPDGNLWFTEYGASRVATITASGSVTEYALAAGRGPTSVANGPDGRVWFSEANANRIGAITTGGTVSEYSIPTPNSQPNGIVAGADGNLYFTETEVGQVGQITTAGTVTNEFALGTAAFDHAAGPIDIAAGPCGLWVTDEKVGRVSALMFSGCSAW